MNDDVSNILRPPVPEGADPMEIDRRGELQERLRGAVEAENDELAAIPSDETRLLDDR